MILAIDIGNTSITCGIFNGDDLVKVFRMPTDINSTVERYANDLSTNIYPLKISGAVIGSVVEDINDRLCCAIKNSCNIEPILISVTINLPISIKVDSPKEVGADRIANAIRAWNLYKTSVIVVDMGTAITFDIINKNGEFIGGIIAPGLKTQLYSLFQSTAKLPDIEIEFIEKAIGTNTKNSILSGVIRGTASMIDGMLEQCKKEMMDEPIIIATGGFCNIISHYTSCRFDLISPNLTLEGLRDFYLETKLLIKH